jgi:mono/diheme cytochrome c family protein
MRKWSYIAAAALLVGALAPFALIAWARAVKSAKPRAHIILDMDSQPKFKAQAPSALFADGRAMRSPVSGTVARGELRADEAFHTGQVDGQWIRRLPVDVDEDLMRRGRERFDIYCAPCHGPTGDGDGIVNVRAAELEEGAWVPAVSYHADIVRERPDGRLFDTIDNGIRTMPAHGPQVPPADRWAIVAYVRALQESKADAADEKPLDDSGTRE